MNFEKLFTCQTMSLKIHGALKNLWMSFKAPKDICREKDGMLTNLQDLNLQN